MIVIELSMAAISILVAACNGNSTMDGETSRPGVMKSHPRRTDCLNTSSMSQMR